jgi:hypothetical protein
MKSRLHDTLETALSRYLAERAASNHGSLVEANRLGLTAYKLNVYYVVQGRGA